MFITCMTFIRDSRAGFFFRSAKNKLKEKYQKLKGKTDQKLKDFLKKNLK